MCSQQFEFTIFVQYKVYEEDESLQGNIKIVLYPKAVKNRLIISNFSLFYLAG